MNLQLFYLTMERERMSYMSAGETEECGFSRFVFKQSLRMTQEEYDGKI